MTGWRRCVRRRGRRVSALERETKARKGEKRRTLNGESLAEDGLASLDSGDSFSRGDGGLDGGNGGLLEAVKKEKGWGKKRNQLSVL
jgi:hypothetical protein